jgi:hypothetical protein
MLLPNLHAGFDVEAIIMLAAFGLDQHATHTLCWPRSVTVDTASCSPDDHPTTAHI